MIPRFNCPRLIGSVVAAISSFGHSNAALSEGELRVIRSRLTGDAIFVTNLQGGPIQSAGRPGSHLDADGFLQAYGQLFGLQDAALQLAIESVEKDSLGQTQLRYQQRHQGIPVFSGDLKIHTDSEGRVLAANGRIYRISPLLNVRSSLSPQQAFHIAARGFESLHPHLEASDLVIVDPGWYGDPPIGERLAYYVIISDESTGLSEAFFTDAHTGQILDRWPFNHDVRYREVYDGQQLAELPGVFARRENEPSSPDTHYEVDVAYDYLGDTYDYFFRAFGRDSIDGRGLALVATVNSRALGCPNAQWRPARLQSVYCYRAVSDDVVAHEVTHGLTQFTAGLIYQNQSGQLNESFSDVFGELVDLFNGNAAFAGDASDPAWPPHETGAGTDFPNHRRGEVCSDSPTYKDGARWLLSEDATAFNRAIRDMWMPTCRDDPDHADSPLQTCDPFDSGGVHSGSGIPNHAFAMLTDGKSFNGFKVRGIGPIKSGAVWYRALTTYLSPASDFQEAYHAFNQSALDLVGTAPNDPRTGLPGDLFTMDDAIQVDLALRAVGMDTPGRCGRTIPILQPDTPPSCAQRREIFFDDFEYFRTVWRTENSGPPTPYNWRRTTQPLPFNRTGVAWFCDDPQLGDCDKQDESAVHSLISPLIQVPQDLGHLRLEFTHYMASEGGWDGGNVSIKVDDRPWQLLPAEACLFNSYNSVILSSNQGNTNPLGGQPGWTGVGGRFGTSVFDLSPYVKRGQTIQLRFDFGKDGCTGATGWFVDDVRLFDCPDCDRNNLGDDLDFHYAATLGPAGPIGFEHPLQLTLPHPPPAAGPVKLVIKAQGDLGLGGAEEFLAIDLNGHPIGKAFEDSGNDCPEVADHDELVVSAEVFNQLAAEGEARFQFVANELVNPTLCDGTSYLRLDISYQTAVSDADLDLIQDACQNCQTPESLLPRFTASLNRYLVFQPPPSAKGRVAAILLEMLPPSEDSLNEPPKRFWLGTPHAHLDDEGHFRHYSTPRCDPAFLDWGEYDEIRVYGELIVPGKSFNLSVIDVACVLPTGLPDPSRGPAFNSFLSTPLELKTAPVRADIVGEANSLTPDGRTDVNDLAAIVDRFLGRLPQLSIVQADLAPSIPDQRVDMRDVAAVVDSIAGRSAPSSAEPACVFSTP